MITIKDAATSGFIDLLKEIIKSLQTEEVGRVKYESNLGKVAYDLGRSHGRLEGWDILIDYLNKKANE